MWRKATKALKKKKKKKKLARISMWKTHGPQSQVIWALIRQHSSEHTKERGRWERRETCSFVAIKSQLGEQQRKFH